MKTKITLAVCTIALMMIWQPVTGQNYFERTILFNDTLPGNQQTLKLLPTMDGNVMLFTARMDPNTNRYEIFMSKSDDAGNELWTSRIAIQQTAVFYSITEFIDSSFYLSGFISNISNFGNLLVHVSKDGILLSSKVISSPDIYQGYGYDITSLNDSSLVMVARTLPQNNYYELGNIIIDAAGNPLSNKFFTINNKVITEARIAKTISGGFVQAMNMRRHNNNNDLILGVMSGDANGNIIWAKQIGDQNSSYQIFDIKQMPSGQIILCGVTVQGFSYNGMVMCLNANGNLEWTRHFSPAQIQFSSIAPNDASSFIITGMFADTSYRTKSVVVKMDLNGQILDDATYRYSDIIVNSQASFKDDNDMFYTVWNYRLFGSLLYGAMISKYDSGFNFCNPYGLAIAATPVFPVDSIQWTDTTYSLISNDVTSLFNQTFDPWGYGIHCLNTGLVQVDGVTADLEIYPNPTTGKIIIRSNSFEIVDAQYKIVNILGKVLCFGDFDKTENILDISLLDKGVYFLQTQISGHTAVNKIVLL